MEACLMRRGGLQVALAAIAVLVLSSTSGVIAGEREAQREFQAEVPAQTELVERALSRLQP